MTSSLELEHARLSKADYALHYVAKGDRRNDLILFLHPAFGDHSCFDQQIDFFAEHHRVVVVDMLGHGMSQVPGGRGSLADMRSLVPEIIAREGYEQAHLVGVSLGALIAQAVAAHAPSAVKTLTVVGGYSIFGVSQAIQRAQITEMLKWVFMIIGSMPRFRRYVARTSAIHLPAQEQFYRSAQSFTRRSFRVMADLNKLMQPAYRPHEHPLQILIGDHERPLLRSVAEAWQQKEPNSEFQIIRNAGHCANMDNPDDFNALLLAWLTRSRNLSPTATRELRTAERS